MTAAPGRLPLRLPQPPAGEARSLEWHVADGALVLPGETLCTAHGSQGKPTSLLSPAPGRLHHFAPSVRHLSPATIIGELEYGAEFEHTVRSAVTAVRHRLSATAAPDDPVRRRQAAEQLQRLRLEQDRLRRDVERLRQHGAPLSAPAPPASAATTTRRAAEQLLTALHTAPPEPVPSPLGTEERRRLLQGIGELRQALIASGKQEQPPALPPEIAKIHAIDALERLFLVRAEECRARIRTFPRQLQEEKLGLWQDLKEAYLRYLLSC